MNESAPMPITVQISGHGTIQIDDGWFDFDTREWLVNQPAAQAIVKAWAEPATRTASWSELGESDTVILAAYAASSGVRVSSWEPNNTGEGEDPVYEIGAFGMPGVSVTTEAPEDEVTRQARKMAPPADSRYTRFGKRVAALLGANTEWDSAADYLDSIASWAQIDLGLAVGDQSDVVLKFWRLLADELGVDYDDEDE